MKKTTVIILAVAFVLTVCPMAWGSSQFEHEQLLRRYGSVDETMWDNVTKANSRIVDQEFYEHVRGIFLKILMEAETEAKKSGRPRDIPQVAFFYASLADHVGYAIKQPADMRAQLAKAYILDRRFDTALQILNIVAQQEPKNILVREEMADLFIHLQMNKEAMNTYEDILKIDSRNKTSLYRLGLLYNTLGRHQMAEKMFKDLLRVDPENDVARRFVDLYEGRLKTSGAQRINEKAIHHFINGERLFAAEDYQAAAEEYAKAVEADPRFARAYVYLGESLTQLKKYSEAINILRHSIEVDPRDPEGYYHLGLTLEKQYNFSQNRTHLQEALSNYQKAHEMAPDNEKFKEDLERARRRIGAVSG